MVLQSMQSKILDGSWATDSRIPSERTLAQSLGVSRSTLREAIQQLSARGLLSSRRGAGVFVVNRLSQGLAAPWMQLLADHPPLRGDMLEFRRIFECAAAGLAAERATEEEHGKIAEILQRMRNAVAQHNVEAEAITDAEFHAALAAATHNAMYRHFHGSVVRMLRDHITRNTYEANNDAAHAAEFTYARMAQHEAIWQAICERAPDAAFRAMHVHLDFVGMQFDE
ncbi:MAG: FCD domain-containing protein [Collimonas sp.]|uniref:FadR/GntR family transcriptional regulator n=1 Tax=Collimonas sp. TaxID=1963772 RepID=UPI0032640DC4